MRYELTYFDGEPVAKLSDPPQYMSLADLDEWMVPLRDDDPDLYSQLVHVWVMLKKFANEVK